MQAVWHPSKSTTIGGFLKALGAECHSLSLKGYQKVAGGLRFAATTGYFRSNPPG
jgi:hypothetical protein